MALAGLFQGLAHGSAEALSQQLYAKQAREQQMRQDRIRAEDIAWRNKLHTADQDYRTAALDHQTAMLDETVRSNTQMAQLERDRLDQSKDQHAAEIGLEARRFASEQSLAQKRLRIDQKANELAKTQNDRMYDLQKKQVGIQSAELGLRRAEAFRDTLGGIASGIGSIGKYIIDNQIKQQQIGIDQGKLRVQEREATVAERNATTNEMRARTDQLSAILRAFGGGGRSGGGTGGGGGTRVAPLGIDRWSPERTQAALGPFIKTIGGLNRTWFPDAKMPINKLMGYAQNYGEFLNQMIEDAGITNPDEVKTVKSHMVSAMMAHPDWRHIRNHAEGDIPSEKIESDFISNFMRGALTTPTTPQTGAGTGGTPPTSTTTGTQPSTTVQGIVANVNKINEGQTTGRVTLGDRLRNIYGEDTGVGEALLSAAGAHNPFSMIASNLVNWKDNWQTLQDKGLLGFGIEKALVEPSKAVRAAYHIAGNYLGRPAGKVMLGGQFGEPSPASDDITIQSYPNTIPDDVELSKRDIRLNAFAARLMNMNVNQLTQLAQTTQDPDELNLIRDRLYNLISMGALQSLTSNGTNNQ